VTDRSLLFAIDFDGTFAADPDLFRGIVALIRAAGHEVVMVTGREDSRGFGDPVRALVGDLMPIVFAGGHWKTVAALQAGYKIDIWVDDNPTYIAPPQTLRETLADLRKFNHPDIVPSP
jgi:hypothetical protein